MSTRPSFSVEHGRRPVRLLLVEDHSELAEVTAEILCSNRMDVLIASSGQEALETAAVFRPEIILCDLFLPDMSGLDLARAFRSKPETNGAVIALHTALHDQDLSALMDQTHNTVIDVFISKPLTDDKVDKLFARFALRQQEL